MSSDKDQLLSMGFEPARVDWALKATKNSGLQPAMDHLINNADQPVPDLSTTGGAEEVDEDDDEAVKAHIKKMGGPVDDGDLVAKSIKCSECGKIFRSQATASFHAERSGHQEFEESTEEIKPLTEEEKKAKLAELREKLAEKRAAQSKIDAKENKANEALRRKAGQDAGKAKEDLQTKEILRDLERKKREKMEDLKAKAAIKAQIEADKRERAEKAAREKALREGKVQETTAPVVAAKPAAAVKSSENPETRLQVRMHTGGAPITKTFPSDNTLIDVAEWVASENLAYNVDTVSFASTFPRKTFSRDEMKKTLKENGLTPSAVLMAISTFSVRHMHIHEFFLPEFLRTASESDTVEGQIEYRVIARWSVCLKHSEMSEMSKNHRTPNLSTVFVVCITMSETITLYELTNEKGSNRTFSPHVWKTKVDFAILGVKPTSELLTFPEVRGDLAQQTNNQKVTVPTIKVGSTGEYITDSWAIALWLEKKYGGGEKTLFPGGEAALPYAKFFEHFVNITLANTIRPLIGIRVYDSLDQESSEWWLKNRYGGDASKADTFRSNANDPSFVESQRSQARAVLETVEISLKVQRHNGNGLWLAGKGPSHLDALLFGFYAFSRVNKDLDEVWNHPDLPALGEWVKAVTAIVGDDELP